MCIQGSQLVRVWSPVETRLTGGVLDCRLPGIIIMIKIIVMVMMMVIVMTMMIMTTIITLPTLPLPPTSPCPGDPYLYKLSLLIVFKIVITMLSNMMLMDAKKNYPGLGVGS